MRQQSGHSATSRTSASTAREIHDLAARINAVDAEHKAGGNRVIYLALPPAIFADTIERLGRAGLAQGPGWTRVVVEKPFGDHLESARSLNDTLHRYFAEHQIYRIDHYLGKESVQNLLVFRFTNPIFEASWNRDRVERVEITVAESLDVAGRGVLRDDGCARRHGAEPPHPGAHTDRHGGPGDVLRRCGAR